MNERTNVHGNKRTCNDRVNEPMNDERTVGSDERTDGRTGDLRVRRRNQLGRKVRFGRGDENLLAASG